MKFFKILMGAACLSLGFYLGLTSFDYDRQVEIKEETLASRDIAAIQDKKKNEKITLNMSKNISSSSEKSKNKEEKNLEKEIFLYVRNLKFQGQSHKRELELKALSEKRMEEDPNAFFEESKNILLSQKNDNLQENEVLLQVALNLRVDEISKIQLLKEISEKRLSKKDNSTLPSDQCFLAKMAIRKLLNMGKINEAKEILTEHEQGEFGSDEDLVLSFIAKPIKQWEAKEVK